MDEMTDAMLDGRLSKAWSEQLGVDLKEVRTGIDDLRPARQEPEERELLTDAASLAYARAQIAAAQAGVAARRPGSDGLELVDQASMTDAITRLAEGEGIRDSGAVEQLRRLALQSGNDGLARANQFDLAAATREVVPDVDIREIAARHQIMHPSDIRELELARDVGPVADEVMMAEVGQVLNDAIGAGRVDRDQVMAIADARGVRHPFNYSELLSHAAVRNAIEGHMTGPQAIAHFEVTDHRIRRIIGFEATRREIAAWGRAEIPIRLDRDMVEQLARGNGVIEQDDVQQHFVYAASLNALNGFMLTPEAFVYFGAPDHETRNNIARQATELAIERLFANDLEASESEESSDSIVPLYRHAVDRLARDQGIVEQGDLQTFYVNAAVLNSEGGHMLAFQAIEHFGISEEDVRRSMYREAAVADIVSGRAATPGEAVERQNIPYRDIVDEVMDPTQTWASGRSSPTTLASSTTSLEENPTQT